MIPTNLIARQASWSPRAFPVPHRKPCGSLRVDHSRRARTHTVERDLPQRLECPGRKSRTSAAGRGGHSGSRDRWWTLKSSQCSGARRRTRTAIDGLHESSSGGHDPKSRFCQLPGSVRLTRARPCPITRSSSGSRRG